MPRQFVLKSGRKVIRGGSSGSIQLERVDMLRLQELYNKLSLGSNGSTLGLSRSDINNELQKAPVHNLRSMATAICL